MKQWPLNDTGMTWAFTDADIVHFYESEPQYWRQDIDLPDGLGDEVDDGTDGEPREEDAPEQQCLPWRRPPEKPAWLQQRCQRGHTLRTPVIPVLPTSNGLTKVEAVFRGVGRLFAS